jgi:hypothetical protein
MLGRDQNVIGIVAAADQRDAGGEAGEQPFALGFRRFQLLFVGRDGF